MSATPSKNFIAGENSLYYRYYDWLHREKDYGREADIVLALFREVTGGAPARILDVGCGTGNHSVELAARGHQVLGVDIDRHMVDMAQEKQGRVSGGLLHFHYTKVEEVPESGFDMAVSLFNVANYIVTLRELHSFIAAVQQRVRGGGLFIFDFINGLAALREPARRKETTVAGEGGDRLNVVLTPHTDLLNEILTLTGHVEARVQGKNVSYEYSLAHRLWTPRVLCETLTAAGFTVLQIIRWMQPGISATADDWKMMVVCQRT